MTYRTLFATLLAAGAAFAVQAHAQDGTAPSAPVSTAPPAAPDPGAEFLAKNAKAPGVVTTSSGLEYKILQSGPAGGASPKVGDEVQVVYQGRLLNGTVFDASTDDNPAALQVGELVPGWNEALQMMKPGDEWELYIPPNLGYGEDTRGPIPGHSVMVFKMKLLSVGPLS